VANLKHIEFEDSKYNWKEWDTLKLTDSKTGETNAYWIWQSMQNWRNWGIMNFTDTKQDWRKLGV